MKLVDMTEHLYTPAQAEAIAAAMKVSDPEWTYRVKHDYKKTGYSFVKVYDEDGCYVGKL